MYSNGIPREGDGLWPTSEGDGEKQHIDPPPSSPSFFCAIDDVDVSETEWEAGKGRALKSVKLSSHP